MSPRHSDHTGVCAPPKHMEAHRCVPPWAHKSHRCVPPPQAHGSHRCVQPSTAHMFFHDCVCTPLIHTVVPLELRGTRETPKAEGARGQEGLPKSCSPSPQILCFGATHGSSGASAMQLVSTLSQEQRCPNTAGAERMGTAMLCARREPHCHPGQEWHHFPRAAALLNTKLQIISYLDQRCVCSVALKFKRQCWG